MPDQVTMTSTTDSEAEVRQAMGLPLVEPVPATPPADPAAGDVDPDPDAVEPPPAGTPAAPRASRKASARIGKVTAQREQVASEAAQLARDKFELAAQLDAARRELEALRAPKAPAAAPDPVAPVSPVAAKPRPKEDDFENMGEYMEALWDWRDAQKAPVASAQDIEKSVQAEIERRQRAAWDAQQQQIAIQQAADYAERRDDAKQVLADFDEVSKAGESMRMPQWTLDYVYNAPHGIPIGYYLVKHPELADRLKSMHPANGLVELGILTARYEAGLLADLPPIPAGARRTAPPPDAPAAVAPLSPAPLPVAPVAPGPRAVVSQAPPPVPRVGGGAPTNGAALSLDEPGISLAEYNRRRKLGITH